MEELYQLSIPLYTCPGESGFICILGWKYSPCGGMVFPTNQRCAVCNVCPTCKGTRKCHDGDLGDISYREWPCPTCAVNPEDDVETTG